MTAVWKSMDDVIPEDDSRRETYTCPKCGYKSELLVYNDGEDDYIEGERCPNNHFTIIFDDD